MIDEQNKDKLTPLLLACNYDKDSIFKYLVDRGADIMVKAADGSLPIHIAASKGKTELMEYLLTNGEDRFIKRKEQISNCNYSGASVLHRAVESGQEKTNGLTPLHAAAISGEDSICKILLERKPTVDMRDNHDRTPLFYAASLNHLSIIETLIDAGANIDESDCNQLTPFLCAIIHNHLSTVQLLIGRNCQVNVVDTSGRNCYHLAVIYDKDLRLLEYFLENVDHSLTKAVDEHQRTPIFYACRRGKAEVLKLLLNYDPGLNTIDEDGNNCLHFSCMEDCVEILTMLLQHSPHLLCSEGENCTTLLHIAVMNSCPNNAQLLLEQGADINRRDCCYETPLDIACIKGNTRIIQMLINYGAAVNSINQFEESALHIAAHYGRAEIANLLMDHGANAKIENCYGKNCLEVAIENGQVDVAITIAIRPCNHDMLLKVGDDRITTMQSIVKWNSKVAWAIMDSYITKTTLIGNHNMNMVKYDFSIIDPGIEFEKNHNPDNGIGSFNAVKTIASSKDISLLEHPLTAKFLDTKWSKYGRYIYTANLAVYTIFILILIIYILEVERLYQHLTSNIVFLGFTRPTDQPASSSLLFSNQTDNDHHKPGLNFRNIYNSLSVIRVFIAIFSAINICRELFQLYHERIRYLLSCENYLELILHSAVLAIISNSNHSDGTALWALGALTIQISFIDLIMFLRKLPVVGKYVLMIRLVTWTAMKVLLVISILLLGFAISFNMLCHRQMSFYTIFLSLFKVIDMTVGELNYSDLLDAIRKGRITYPDAYMLVLLIILFIFFMPILMMNLLVTPAYANRNYEIA
ncbi:Transient receptor potential cation channel subfamily A member 1 [Trichoplax sp. H2]|nr:Transient receptor potential cation channel subfamily A member 1 [Trichoplax sp. H2]|eukprot:RDD38691.1 Transient receptor potential cation channel subfamily A member 1 [Trichoplax sp. H2]